MSETIIKSNGVNNVETETPETANEDEYDPQYKPIISLPPVEVFTNEENESELLKIRAKLYRFDTTSDPAEWKERGTGELKLLQNKENNAIRVVMRRDKTFKVCANHFITPMLVLRPSAGSEKAFVYNVLADFADETPRNECLAIRFATIENANLFKSKIDEAKEILIKDCNLYNGKCDEDTSSEDEADEPDEEPEEDAEPVEKSEKEDESEEQVTKKLAELDVNELNVEEPKK